MVNPLSQSENGGIGLVGEADVLTQLIFGGSMTAYQLSQVARGLVDAKYSRDKEFEADRFGVIYARKAGSDPTASISFFERLQRMEKDQPGLVHAFEDHPDTPARIKSLRAQLRQIGYRTAGPWTRRFRLRQGLRPSP